MKVAMWAVGLFVLSLLGVVLVNLFGNITVTNQLNYTTMKNTVEASMYDALDIAHYRAGFCLCTNNTKKSGKWVFNSDEEYELSDIKYNNDGDEICESTTKENCEVVFGEYRIKPKTFSESLVRRFAEMVTNNKDYQIIIQDIIEYPPKVSVKIVSEDKKFSPTETDTDGYSIVNQIDAIIETSGKVVSTVATPTPKVTPTPTPSPDEACFRKSAGDNADPPYVYRWGTDKQFTSAKGWVKLSKTKASKQSECAAYCYKNASDKYEWGMPNDHPSSAGWKKQSSITKKANCKPAGCQKYGWTQEDSKNKVQGCPTDSKGDKNKPVEGTYYWKSTQATCTTKIYKICFSCSGGGSVTNSYNANCIEASSCSATAPCPAGSSVTSRSCSTENKNYTCMDCAKMVYRCLDK